MIEKLEIMAKAVATGGYSHENVLPYSGSHVELSVSTLDLANKLNEVIEYLNAKESNAS